jgi:hypothetical protein
MLPCRFVFPDHCTHESIIQGGAFIIINIIVAANIHRVHTYISGKSLLQTYFTCHTYVKWQSIAAGATPRESRPGGHIGCTPSVSLNRTVSWNDGDALAATAA